jgi:hypothetical protein
LGARDTLLQLHQTQSGLQPPSINSADFEIFGKRAI